MCFSGKSEDFSELENLEFIYPLSGLIFSLRMFGHTAELENTFLFVSKNLQPLSK